MTITSKDNEKLKLVRKLSDRKHREREGLFCAEGEDLLAAGQAAEREPAFVLVAAGAGIDGIEVEVELLASASTLGSGTQVVSVWPIEWSEPAGPVCVYLDRIGDPGNVGAIVRTADALVGGSVVLGPGCADPYGPKAVRASMGSIFAIPIAHAPLDATPAPRIGLVAHGGEPPGATVPPLTLCLGAERDGLSPEVAGACDRLWTIPLRPGAAESLNVAAATAIALGWISSPAGARESGMS